MRPRARAPSTTRRPARCSATCCSATPADVDAAVQRRPRRLRRAGADTSVVRRARVMFAFRELIVRAHRRAGADHLRRARQDLRGRQGRGRPRDGGRRVRVRDRGADQGRVLRPGLHRRRPALVPPAAGRVRGDHAVQLPDHGPACGCTRSRSRPGTRSCSSRPSATRASPTSSPTCTRRRASRTACSTSSTATRWRSTRCSTTRTSTAISFVGSTPIAKYIYERATRAGKRVQALGGAKNHAIVMPDADLDFASDQLIAAGLRLRRPALHGHLVTVAVGDAADELVEKMRAEGAQREGRPGPGARRRRWARSSRRGARPRRGLHRPRRGRRGRRRPRARRSRATASGSARR